MRFLTVFFLSLLIQSVSGMALSTDSSRVFEVTAGTLIQIPSFASTFVEPRPVDVWLPPGYDARKTYAVVYMHDGQMLWDASKTWNGQAWDIDSTAALLQRAGRTAPFIVVGVWNTGETRRSEYFPEAVVSMIPQPKQQRIVDSALAGKPRADAYLRFLTEELKPYIDITYSTKTGNEHTFLVGSSMGGLISLYGISKYPNVFGGAACLSIHTPMVPASFIDASHDADMPGQFRAWLDKNLPETNSRRIYLDYGDQTLDATYAPYHKKLEAVFEKKGWSAPAYESRFFPGADHSERAWAARMEAVFIFLLGK